MSDAHVKVMPDATDTRKGLSPTVWEGIDLPRILGGDRSYGYGDFDDFVRWGITPTITTTIGVDRYNCFGSSGATITPDDAVGGALVLTEATDNESVSMTTEQHPFWINSSQGSLAFEARVKFSTITTLYQGWVVGLMDTTALAAAVPVTATGAIADMNFVGFHKPEANTTAFDASYKADGVTAVEVNSDIGTLVAATYVKLGMRFDAHASVLSFYINGQKQTSTKAIGAAAGTDFPDDIGLGFVIGQTLGNSSAITTTIDWWACAQLEP